MAAVNLSKAAVDYLVNGLSVIPIKNKVAQHEWKIFQSSLMQVSKAEYNFRDGDGIAIITGKISKNIEVIDVDLKNDISGTLRADLTELIENHLPGILSKLTIIKTKNNGLHIYYRCSKIGGNTKLANRLPTEDELKKKT